MKQVLIKSGLAVVSEVPAPKIDAGEVLVQVYTSCLSVGTEMSGVRSSATPIWKKALQQPEKIVTTLKTLKAQGLKRTWSLIEEKRDAAHPTGYSAAGVVVAVGDSITDLVPGDRVACAGAQCAYHAEFIKVPRNLCVPIPDELGWEEASTVTLGAIALQGVRRANPTLGETFVVIGLGILGQLSVQLLKANGCKVIGLDIDKDRIGMAEKMGMDFGMVPGTEGDAEKVARLTNGFGADGIIITAATSSDAVVSSAFKMCRKKGRVVLVGDVGLHLNRSDFYVKEIDFFISSSYGPGRYDHKYEEQGLDYPLPFVRWTENRNMQEYLFQLSSKKVQIDSLISARYPVTDAENAYLSLNAGGKKQMMVLLTYPDTDIQPSYKIDLKSAARVATGKIRIAVLGAGGFARSAHLPNLQSLSDQYQIEAVVTRSGHSAMAIAKQFGASYASTDYDAVLADPNIDAVIIATRHDLHAKMTLAALKAGKHVLVEKPLALSTDEVNELDAFISGSKDQDLPVLLTGYNRRFSPYAKRMAEMLNNRVGPFIINYRMNAGYITPDHWVHGKEGGGRNLGEACHIYDLFTYLANSEVTKVSAHAIAPQTNYYGRNDNFVATISFSNGSIATLTYTAAGSKNYPKEVSDVYVDGKMILLEDYKKMDIMGGGGRSLKTPVQEKGLKEELIAFANAINSGEWPIPWWQQLQTARIGLEVEQYLFEK
jgi:predicted dehydrogenase/threonine dehydrogenase-like Zn-dependent dehydrogenase